MLQQNKPQMFSTAFYLVKGQTRGPDQGVGPRARAPALQTGRIINCYAGHHTTLRGGPKVADEGYGLPMTSALIWAWRL